MRNPNGYGCVKRLSGNRRRPYAFVVTEHGRHRVVTYFETHEEALMFQADYARRHEKRPLSGMTFCELYRRWLPAHTERVSPSASALAGYRAAFSHCAPLHGLPISEIRYRDLQGVIDGMAERGLSYSSRKKVRSLMTLMFRYAARMEYCARDFAGLLHIGKNKPVRPHSCFTRQKINRLWKSKTDGADTVLILIYTGLRVGEMLALRKSDVNRRGKFLRVTHAKTAAGVRVVPIHSKIWPLIEARLETPDDHLITHDGKPYTYAAYRAVWKSVMREIHGEKHTPHDTRHTCATLLDNAEVNEAAKKRILGHAGKDVTEAVYTHKGLRQLRKAIEKIR